MKKKEKHIGKFFRDPLPEPEVPADDAWAGMSDMLGAAAGGTPVNGDAGQWFSGLVKIKGLILTSLSLVSATAVVIYQLSDSPASTSKPAPVLTQSEQIKNHDEPIPKAVPEQIEENNTIPKKPEQQEQNNTIPNNPEQKEPILNQNPENPIPESEYEKPVAGSKTAAGRESEGKLSNNSSRVKNSKSKRQRTENSPQTPPIPAVGKENAAGGFRRDSQSLETAPSPNPEKRFNIRSLKPLNVHFRGINTDLGRRIVTQNFAKQPVSEKSETNRSFHLGLEWTLNSSLKSTAYIATGADSIPRVARLLIPGIFATTNFSKSSITFSFLPYQSYFGGNKLVRQIADSLNTDSIKTYTNALFIKAVGMNFSAQYQYHVTRFFALNAGASYTILTSALFRPQTQNWQGKLLDGQLTTLKKSTEISPYINPYLFTLKAGIALTPGRFQAGLNVILPLSNISKSSQFPVKTLNGQVYLRYLVW
ncbi:hypothetical protein [Dyadobacter sp. CY343]|uniref:hypothetical protein n=1 Tax=Dyadobacter sp. CY343 TaxID=2907299 RepID=UPI001F2E4438|nr:hypothetical protein [Dyadobacter sp. CY343]MCE7061530.1 hypothetical protein [Dyadobacter sp. CY343]